MKASSSWFQRYLLPGFVFQAAVIAGGYWAVPPAEDGELPPVAPLPTLGAAVVVLGALSLLTILLA